MYVWKVPRVVVKLPHTRTHIVYVSRDAPACTRTLIISSIPSLSHSHTLRIDSMDCISVARTQLQVQYFLNTYTMDVSFPSVLLWWRCSGVPTLHTYIHSLTHTLFVTGDISFLKARRPIRIKTRMIRLRINTYITWGNTTYIHTVTWLSQICTKKIGTS